ncbi:MAG: LuxR C-terminal-related transcriptional regulator [Coriobacteriales bacterium]|jgi:DNA-binding CsgD family transcriptional regulator|nr:LuxR C-terminal-related transcriptional regulator [Coriobacteriales bacterium]
MSTIFLQRRSFKAGAFVRCLLAFLLIRLNALVLNANIFPQFMGTIPEAREFATLAFIIVVLLLTVLAQRKPGFIHAWAFLTVSLIAISLGVVLLYFGITLSFASAILMGVCLMNVGTAWVFTLVGLALLRLSLTQAFFSLSLAMIANFLSQSILIALPLVVVLPLLLVSNITVIILTAPLANPLLDALSTSATPADLSITHPLSFLPLSHTLFLSFFIFTVGFGFALTYGSVNGVPPLLSLSTIPLILIVLISFFRKRRMNIDRIYLIAALLMIAGYLVIPVLPKDLALQSAFQPANTLIYAGSECFTLVIWAVLIAVGKRNLLGALPVITFGSFVNAFGTLVGTSLGHLINGISLLHTSLEPIAATLMVFSIIVYILATARSFSFEQTAEEIKDFTAPPVLPDSSQLEQGYKQIAEEYRLTPRETDIIELLARGRNIQTIQSKLVLSRNTIKTHVRNIYAKLDVHSQQELIDLVEQKARELT